MERTPVAVRDMRRSLLSAHTRIRDLESRLVESEQRAERAEKAAADGWQFAKLVLRGRRVDRDA